MFRMKTPLNNGERAKSRKGYPSEHDFEIVFTLTMNVLALVDEAQPKLSSTVAQESLFHIRGFLVEEMEHIKEFLRPRR